VILEYGGVSDEILNLANDICEKLISKSYETRWYEDKYDGNIIGECNYRKNFHIMLSDNEYFDSVSVRVYGYFPEKIGIEEAIDILNERGMLEIQCSTNRWINMEIPFPVGEQVPDDFKNFITSALNHEIKHTLQYAKQAASLERKGKAYEFDPNYAEVYNKDSYGFNESDKKIAEDIKYCYYIFSSFEIDARLQSIFVEYPYCKDLRKCESYKEVMNEIQTFNNFLNSANNQEFYKKFDYLVRTIYNNRLNAKRFFRICQKGIDRFNEHLRRILGRVNAEYGVRQ
jgi:hypothetical protein